MANPTIFQAPPDFNMNNLVNQLMQKYQAQGFYVNAVPLGQGVTIDFRKDDEGFKKYVGLAQAVKANIMVQNGTVSVNYTDAEWNGKIVAFVIGWFLCWIPWITAIIGAVQQSGLPTNIGNDILMMASGSNPHFNPQASAPMPPNNGVPPMGSPIPPQNMGSPIPPQNMNPPMGSPMPTNNMVPPTPAPMPTSNVVPPIPAPITPDYSAPQPFVPTSTSNIPTSDPLSQPTDAAVEVNTNENQQSSCPHCNESLKAGAKFCGNCGGKVNE